MNSPLDSFPRWLTRPSFWSRTCLPFALMVACACAASMSPGSEAARAQRIAWWREARFGVFIHWGLYAIPGRGEWAQWNEQIPVEEYAKLADQFHPSAFDADAWAKTIKDSGAKYAVLTARHHDGFSLFDSRASDFTSMKTAAHHDFVADYVRAMRAAGVHVGLYYSPLDWRFPGYLAPGIYRASAEAMRTQYHRQVEELLSNYGKIDVLWFDGGEADWLSFGGDWHGAKWEKRPKDKHYAGAFDWQHDQVYAMLRRLQPDILINGRADMPEDFHSREGDGALGGFDQTHPWELCTTIVKGPWGWDPQAPVKPLSDLVQLLVKAAGRDGNFILNIGPRPDGRIDPAQADRLREIGDWLRQNGASIYGTRGGPYLPGAYGVSTRHGNRVFVHVLNWPAAAVALPDLPCHVVRATRIGGEPVELRQTSAGIELTVPPAQRDAIDTIIVLELDADTASLAPVSTAVGS